MYQLKLLVGPGVNYIVIGKKVMATEKKDRPWDGRSRPSDDTYRKEFNRIFSKKDIKEIEKIVDEYEEKKQKTLHEELMEGYEQEKKELENEEE
jgi:predicted ribosome quality control (RQC) complex YloA/Tae2 family protein